MEMKVRTISKKIYDIDKFEIKGKVVLDNDDGTLILTSNPYHEG